jgi:hypothetical protein
MSFQSMLGTAAPFAALGAYLDGLSPQARLTEALSLRREEQRKLYDLALGQRSLTLESLVPGDTAGLKQVTHEGRNSLAIFSAFAKVFYRPVEASHEFWGFNRTGAVVTTLVGPGYFVATVKEGEILIDYTKEPGCACPDGPVFHANHERLSKFVYFNMVDTLRGVSQHVTIGRAARGGRTQNNWFILCRT